MHTNVDTYLLHENDQILAFILYRAGGRLRHVRPGSPGDSSPAPAPTGLEWEQEQNLHLNKEAPTAFFASFSDLQSALKVLPENSKWRKSLNGQWKFHWAKDPQSRRPIFTSRITT